MDTHQIDSLKSKLDPFSVVAQYSHQELKPGRNLRCPNQKHAQTGNTPPASMDYNTGLWKCWGCPAQGDLIDWIGYSLFADWNHENRGHNFITLLDMLSGLQIGTISKQERQARQSANQPVIKQTFDPDSIQKWHDNLLLHDGLLEWLHKRGVNLKMILSYKLGYSENRLMIPHFYRGVCIAVKHRTNPLNPTGNKYLSLKGSSFAVPYNADCLHTPQDKVYIVETELDALAIMALKDTPTIALPAGGITPKLSSLLLFAKEIVLIRDHDSAGEEMGRKLKAQIPRAKVITTPLEFIKDVGAYVQEFKGLWDF